jgi:putative flippase GtrA
MPQSKSLFSDQKIFDFGFDVELLFLAQRKGLKIAEVPVLWFNDPKSTVDPVKDAIRMFLDLLKIRMYHAQPKTGIVDLFYYLIYRYRTFWRFSIVGVTNTLVDYSIFYSLTRTAGLDSLWANPISVESAILWSFIWNSLWTFSERKSSKSLIVRFFIFQFVSLGGLAVSQLSLLLLNKYLSVFDLVAKAITIPIVLIFNYILNSRWTFKDKAKSGSSWLLYFGFVLLLMLIYLFLLYANSDALPFF